MMKKPFSIRVESTVSDRFKALSTVLGIDGSELLKEIVNDRSEQLNDKQKAAYEALLNCWKNAE
ncbi:hypothetical protein [Lederbergia citri]|uniref:Uncharacterized protein n=1 Tax=Lederbergia citri TaxID=2833580 RepID=A0A942YGG7_9BACI|nr:hypothetical protein [Lederbergia citri]MBS4194345.1 hypothetical protein [Lederbergia citri]